MADSEEPGIIGETIEEGLPVIYRFVDVPPDQETRARLPWLTIVSWAYDRLARNGMPPKPMNDQMVALEHAIDAIEAALLCRHVYSRTGNGLKELAYYITDRDQFIGAFNAELRAHPRYPIEINFYEDREWSDFQKVRELFKSA